MGASSGTLPVGESMAGVESTPSEVVLTQAQATALVRGYSINLRGLIDFC